MCGNPFKAVSRAVRWVSKKVKNTYKDVSGITKMEREAKKKQAEMERLAAEKQKELDRIAAQMEQKAAAQKAEMARLTQQQTDADAAQRARVADLQAQQEQQNAALEAEQLQIEAAGQSLRVLAQQGTTKAPTATKSRRRRPGGARQTSATQDLRVGSSGRGGGVGPNLGT